MKLSELEGEAPWDIPPEKMENLKDLLIRMNELEEAYGKPLIVTSGYRTVAKHTAIYNKLNRQRVLDGKPQIPIPLGSQHLQGNAVDCYDPDPQKDLRIWTKLNIPLLEKIGLWVEEYDEQPRVHYQRVAPKSGRRFFKA